MIWVFLILLVVSFLLGVRYERQRQQREKIDYVHSMGAMWGKRPMDGESENDFRLRLIRAMMEPPNVRPEEILGQPRPYRTADKTRV